MSYWYKVSDYTYRRLPLVYSRDFAYANSVPVILRMARTNIADTSARSFADLLTGPTVDFYVGPERRQWSIHRNLLCHHSPYFEAEFLGSDAPKVARKSGELQLELPDEDSAGFELLVKWLYQGRLDDMSDMTDEKKYDYSVACFKLYMLCDKFNLPLKNEAIDRYRQGLSEAQLVPDADEINDIYRRSPIASPFRKLMTQIAARQIMDPGTDKDAESYRKCFEDNPDFAVEMINAIKAGTGGVLFDDPTDGNQCDYHDHSDGQKCHLKGKVSESKARLSPPKRFLAHRTKSAESAPQLSLLMEPSEFEPVQRSNHTSKADWSNPTAAKTKPDLHRRASMESVESTATSDTSMAETDLSGETLVSPSSPTNEFLPKLPPSGTVCPLPEQEQGQHHQPSKEDQAQTAPMGQEKSRVSSMETTTAPVAVKAARQLGKDPLSYVDALRLRIPRENDLTDRGLWDYFRGRE